jgi:predicted nucleic acid-binding protein
MKTAPTKIKHVLLDVNVCIDLIVNRSISPQTKKIFFAVLLHHNIKPFIPAFSIDTVYYILNSSMKIEKLQAKSAIYRLLKFTELLHTTDLAVNQAFSSDFPDFEDGLINALAETSQIDAIITNNVSDFSRSSLPVYRPSDFISLF